MIVTAKSIESRASHVRVSLLRFVRILLGGGEIVESEYHRHVAIVGALHVFVHLNVQPLAAPPSADGLYVASHH